MGRSWVRWVTRWMGEREILAADRVSSDRLFCYVAFCETLLFLSSFTRFLFKQCGLSPVTISWTVISMSIVTANVLTSLIRGITGFSVFVSYMFTLLIFYDVCGCTGSLVRCNIIMTLLGPSNICVFVCASLFTIVRIDSSKNTLRLYWDDLVSYSWGYFIPLDLSLIDLWLHNGHLYLLGRKVPSIYHLFLFNVVLFSEFYLI